MDVAIEKSSVTRSSLIENSSTMDVGGRLCIKQSGNRSYFGEGSCERLSFQSVLGSCSFVDAGRSDRPGQQSVPSLRRGKHGQKPASSLQPERYADSQSLL